MIRSLDYKIPLTDMPQSRSLCRPDAAPQSGRCVLHDDPGDHRSGNRVQQSEELLQLIQSRIGDVDDVLVFDGKALGEKIAISVAEIETVDDRRTAARSRCQGSRL